MHKCTVDIWDRLQDVLQRFAEVMAISQAHTLIKDDIDLDIKLIAGMVRLQTLDLLNGFSETHGQVQEHVTLVGRRGGAGQVADVTQGRASPVENDENREQEAAQRVHPPELSVEADYSIREGYLAF
jgi:hypothetical protein